VDWDTTLIAPRERDLRMVLDRELTGWDEYVAVAGAVSLNQEAIQLYDRWWDLTDIAIFIALFRRPHTRTDDTIASWENLVACLTSKTTAPAE
jgi:spectinomycin phosphotransferase